MTQDKCPRCQEPIKRVERDIHQIRVEATITARIEAILHLLATKDLLTTEDQQLFQEHRLQAQSHITNIQVLYRISLREQAKTLTTEDLYKYIHNLHYSTLQYYTEACHEAANYLHLSDSEFQKVSRITGYLLTKYKDTTPPTQTNLS